ncbi:MAG: hypothetical protein U0V70_03170 [Terriglobia bacterium]
MWKRHWTSIIGESLPRASESLRPAPERLPAPPQIVDTASAIASGGTLTQNARAEFVAGLTSEVRRKIEEKPYIWAGVTFIAAVVVLAGINKVLALVVAVVGAVIVFTLVKNSLERQYLHPIATYSDQMLVTRYNEMKADRRAAGTRAAIWWAVILIIGVILFLLWASAHRPS